MIRERIQEIIDFAKAESPYRSANKGWITNDVFLQIGSASQQNSNQFDQLAKVSFYWQPIIQIVSIIFLVIAVSTFLAFSPLAFSKGKLNSITSIFDIGSSQIQANQIVASKISNEINQSEKSLTDNTLLAKKIVNLELSKSTHSIEMPPTNVIATHKKMITATDLFQPKHF